MKQKQLYVAPRAQAFVVQAEGVVCQSLLEIAAIDDITKGFQEQAIIEDASSALWW